MLSLLFAYVFVSFCLVFSFFFFLVSFKMLGSINYPEIRIVLKRLKGEDERVKFDFRRCKDMNYQRKF